MAAPGANLAIPPSILDTDLYKFTMQQAVLHHFPDVQATYRFTNRNKNVLFSRQCIERFRAAVSYFTDLSLTRTELEWLQSTCPYFTQKYLDYLSAYRYKPEQVHITYIPISEDGMFGEVSIEATGPWVETILWEVPLMACLSETYFQTVMTDWNYDGQEDLAYVKAKDLLEAECTFSEFGTRRRRSYHAQDVVIKALVRASKDISSSDLSGTSNVHFAHKYNISVIGTIAHEWFMGVAALKGYEHANSLSLDLWEEVYRENTPLIALTDTFSTTAFFKEFVTDPDRARLWAGLRQDSGDPFTFGPRVKEMYLSIGIDPATKSLIYSDSLSVQKALNIKKQCDELGLKKISFGIGTFLTNDFGTQSSGGTEKSKALNMVIKLGSVNDKPCVKISDDLTKNTGDKATVEHVKRVFNLPL
ncbi:nicotinate phosphoribosyltransferase [Crucibulum laeve]|uniref:Nicotinate phosphoribosyltransferase n=1 Tax=Crucibulum laeve TaxID=68775 RepID=A0A5C3M5A5_9AGAR|nr:nicotinate phosphoribosyltransferase [Crucibulum laeve]